MLVNTFGKNLSASLVVKDSNFYIEVAKFVQAYTVILSNPNEFMQEIGEAENNQTKMSWDNLKKIMQKCDFGFSQVPTDSDLLIFYNYAIEMGTIAREDKRLATVEDIADAQKNYYNFVDDAKDRAEAEFLKHHRIAKIREKEVLAVRKKLNLFSFQRWTAFSLMIVAVIFFCIGVAGLIFNNPLVDSVGGIIPFGSKQYVGAVIVILLSLLMFWLCDRWNLKSKQEYLKLNHASELLFSTDNQDFITEQILRYKLDLLKKDHEKIVKEINDENKTFDVKTNIDKLLETNIYYQKFLNSGKNSHSLANKLKQMSVEESLNIKNQAHIEEPQAIITENPEVNGQLDDFDKNKQDEDVMLKSEDDKYLDKAEDDFDKFNKMQEENNKLAQKENIKQQENQETEKYIDYIIDMLGNDNGYQRGE